MQNKPYTDNQVQYKSTQLNVTITFSVGCCKVQYRRLFLDNLPVYFGLILALDGAVFDNASEDDRFSVHVPDVPATNTRQRFANETTLVPKVRNGRFIR